MNSTTNKEDLAKKYVKLEQKEHVLTRPGMYIGSIEMDTYDTYVYSKEAQKMTKKTIQFTPGLFKIFDEILVNAIDHSIRLKGTDSPNQLKNIRVSIDSELGVIEVTNDGDGVEIVMHPEHKVYIPELIFGNLLTSTNYDDTEEKTVGGQNGLGAKCTNIFSEFFEIETIDSVRKQIYFQRFEKNMSVIHPPKITRCVKKPYTTIRFKPDYPRFKLEPGSVLYASNFDIITKRVIDACAVTDPSVNVWLNGSKLEHKSFEKYLDLYIEDKSTKVHEQINDRWEIAAGFNNYGGFEQVSFVNGIWTIRGGKHVDYILNQITKKLIELIQKKKKDTVVKQQSVKENLILFVKATIVNPSFDSQSKETLTTPISKFGSKAEVSDKFIEKLYKTGIVEKILQISGIQENKELQKTDGKKKSTIRGLPKLEDANWAGTSKSGECTLILTEGDSAASMAIAGLSEVGRDRFGVFPLKGKLMNVKDQTIKKIAENEEITNLKKIIGLETGKEYKSVSDLRYGKIMILTDQDSVTGDTPLLLRRNGKVYIETIESLTNDYKTTANDFIMNSLGREYGKTDFEVWTESGWTQIKHIFRHKVNKRIYRVISNKGIVDVTEDHSLLDANSNEISPKNLKVGESLLASFPKLTNDKLSTPLLKLFRDMSPSLQSSTNCEMVYVEGKLAAQQAYFILTRLGYTVQLENDLSRPDFYELRISKGLQNNINERQKNVNCTCQSILNLGKIEQYVYDLETENHHFQAGIGELIVHNTDGSHIKGLLFNMFYSMWPSLVKCNQFLTSMLTPIVKVTKGKQILEFYSLTDYEKWVEQNPIGWDIKYYKGLGTSTSEEAKKYFKDMKAVKYVYNNDASDEKLDLAFNKKRADERKEWLGGYDRQKILDFAIPEVSYEDFVDKELIHFSNYDVERSIPSLCDGLKISQRKILYCCFKKNLTKEIKGARFEWQVTSWVGAMA
jgi:DNA gyrase/topoisomerase IV subunit B